MDSIDRAGIHAYRRSALAADYGDEGAVRDGEPYWAVLLARALLGGVESAAVLRVLDAFGTAGDRS